MSIQIVVELYSTPRMVYEGDGFAVVFNGIINFHNLYYSETLNNEYIERFYQMSYSSLSDNGMLQIFSF